MRTPKSSSSSKTRAGERAIAKPTAPRAKTKAATPPARAASPKAAATPKAAASPKPVLKSDAIVTIGCAGFPVPATRYFKEFMFVEVQETHVALPGMGTIRRWKREAPPGFSFSLLAPREIGQEGFREGKVVESALKSLTEVAKELQAKVAIFVAPPEFASGRSNKHAVRDFLGAVKRKFARVVWEPPPGWDADEAEALAAEAGAIAARDPLMSGLSSAPVAYYRLPGPAGHKSRYEDPAIDRLADLALGATHKDATYVFTNVDMFADAKRLKKAMKL